MKNSFIWMWEKIYLKDILKIETWQTKGIGYGYSINYISDFYRNKPNPIFTMSNSYACMKARDKRVNYLFKRWMKYQAYEKSLQPS
jgi:hypothetical protein